MKDLKIIARYIRFRITIVSLTRIVDSSSRLTFLNNCLILLERLIDDPADPLKDPIDVKASRQLLCCIGIDLKYNNISSEYLFEIFSKIDFSDTTTQAIIIINDAIFRFNFSNLKSNASKTNNFCIFICQIKDWHYYLRPRQIGVSINNRSDFARKKIIDHIKTGKATIALKDNKLIKNINCYFWMTTASDFDIALKQGNLRIQHPSAINYLVDALGLSHFCNSFRDDWFRQFFVVNLGSLTTETVKPNFTNIAWSTPTVGFLSAKGNVGATCSFTGNVPGKLSEKIFSERIIENTEMDTISIYLAPNNIQPETVNGDLSINCNSVIQEGIYRFFN